MNFENLSKQTKPARAIKALKEIKKIKEDSKSEVKKGVDLTKLTKKLANKKFEAEKEDSSGEE